MRQVVRQALRSPRRSTQTYWLSCSPDGIHFDLRDAVHIGHSTGGGEVVHYIARHGESRVAKAVLISAVPPLMVQTEAGGSPFGGRHDPTGALASATAQVASVRDDPAARLALMYLVYRDLAEAEAAPERFFMNVALLRVLYAHALAAAPGLALGRFAPLGRLLGDPRLGMAGVFLSLRRVLPNRYPLAYDVERYIADEQRLGRMLDYAVIVPRLQRLYEWSAHELGEARLLELVHDGNPIYAWPFEQRHVWRTPHMPFVAQLLERVTRGR